MLAEHRIFVFFEAAMRACMPAVEAGEAAAPADRDRPGAGCRAQALAAAIALFTTTALGSAIPSSSVRAHSYKMGDIAVGHIWAPPPGADAEGLQVYGPILNRGDAMVRLVGASTTVAERVRFRRKKDGETTWPDAVDLRPGKAVALAPWREHIWLSGLKAPIKEGGSFDLTLDFAEAGQLMIKVVVEDASGH